MQQCFNIIFLDLFGDRLRRPRACILTVMSDIGDRTVELVRSGCDSFEVSITNITTSGVSNLYRVS